MFDEFTLGMKSRERKNGKEEGTSTLISPASNSELYHVNAAGTGDSHTTTNGYDALGQSPAYDSDTGLYNERNRMYSPTLGRWMQADPAGYVNGGNLYQFVESSPTDFVDPFGLAANNGPYWHTGKDKDRVTDAEAKTADGSVKVWKNVQLTPENVDAPFGDKGMVFWFNATRKCNCHWYQFVHLTAKSHGKAWTGMQPFPTEDPKHKNLYREFGDQWFLDTVGGPLAPRVDDPRIIKNVGSSSGTFDNPDVGGNPLNSSPEDRKHPSLK